MALGFYDVDGMLDSAPPKQLEEWEAFYWLEPFGEPWKRTSLNTSRTMNTLYSIAAGISGGKELQDSDLIDDDAFVPKRDTGEPDRNIQQQCDAADSLEGFGF